MVISLPKIVYTLYIPINVWLWPTLCNILNPQVSLYDVKAEPPCVRHVPVPLSSQGQPLGQKQSLLPVPLAEVGSYVHDAGWVLKASYPATSCNMQLQHVSKSTHHLGKQ